MDERLRDILGLASGSDLDRIAAGALGASAVSVIGQPSVELITAPRADPRTIGVVKVSGSARKPNGVAAPWSVVAKIVKLTETHSEVAWTRPEIEEIVYEERYFASDGLRFRPARCHLVSRLDEAAKVFWLEDSTDAEQAPFGVKQLSDMARDLGEWSAFHRTAPELKFPLPRDIFTLRWAQPALVSRYARLHTVDASMIRRCFGDVPVEMLHELRALFLAQNERGKSLPHCLVFGDCQVGNLFHRPGETIAVDWASLAYDPLGADAGALVGSMLFRPGGSTIAANERMIFESYVDGLKASGWSGEADDVRRGYFCQFGHYLASTIGLAAVTYAFDEWPRADLELRMKAPWEALPELTADLIAFYPAFIKELRELAAR